MKTESGKIKRKLQESESFELKSKIRRNSESDMRKRESETEFSKSNNKMLRSQKCKCTIFFLQALSYIGCTVFLNGISSLDYLTITESIGEKNCKSKLLCIEYHLHAIIFCILLHVCNLLSLSALSITCMQSYFVACLQPFILN